MARFMNHESKKPNLLQAEGIFMIDLIVHFLVLGFVIFMLAETLPGMHVKSYGTAVLVAFVYSLINITLGTVLKILGIPFILLTLGLFLLVINTMLLWLTDKLMDSFEIDSMGVTFMAAIVITIADTILGRIL